MPGSIIAHCGGASPHRHEPPTRSHHLLQNSDTASAMCSPSHPGYPACFTLESTKRIGPVSRRRKKVCAPLENLAKERMEHGTSSDPASVACRRSGARPVLLPRSDRRSAECGAGFPGGFRGNGDENQPAARGADHRTGRQHREHRHDGAGHGRGNFGRGLLQRLDVQRHGSRPR